MAYWFRIRRRMSATRHSGSYRWKCCRTFRRWSRRYYSCRLFRICRQHSFRNLRRIRRPFVSLDRRARALLSEYLRRRWRSRYRSAPIRSIRILLSSFLGRGFLMPVFSSSCHIRPGSCRCCRCCSWRCSTGNHWCSEVLMLTDKQQHRHAEHFPTNWAAMFQTSCCGNVREPHRFVIRYSQVSSVSIRKQQQASHFPNKK